MFKNKTFTYLIALILISLTQIRSQTINFIEYLNLPSEVKESSGLLSLNDGHSFWTINDSDSKPNLYEIDTLGNLIRTVKVKNASNKDWEEICSDPSGNIYIGDFGNNDNNRKDQVIYKINLQNLDHNMEVDAEKITIKYTQQTAFPPLGNQLNYDMEAMIWLKNKLHLFSKNRTSPFSGYTYHYILSDQAGDYMLTPVDSFKTGPGPFLIYWVTAAAISPDETQLLLLSYDKCWLFSPLNHDSIFSSPVRQLSFAQVSQKEGVFFNKQSDIYFSDEFNSTLNNGGKIYKAPLKNILSTKNNFIKRSNAFIYVKEFLNIDLSKIDLIEIIDLQGKNLVHKEMMSNGRLNLINLASGLYFVICKSGEFIERIPIFKE